MGAVLTSTSRRTEQRHEIPYPTIGSCLRPRRPRG